MLASEGKNADAQKLLEGLVKDPSLMVSKDEASLALAQVIGKTNPAEALKMLDKLRMSPRLAVSRLAVASYTDIDQANQKK